jgi:hypothetical protein
LEKLEYFEDLRTLDVSHNLISRLACYSHFSVRAFFIALSWR